MIPPMKVVFPDEDRKEILGLIDEALRTGQLAQGSVVGQFEELFASRTRAKHAVAVNSGTAALEATFKALGVGLGVDVLVPTDTFIATAAAVINCGGRAVLVDVDPDTVAPTVEILEAARTAMTEGVALVHIGGLITPEIERIKAWCDQEGLWLVEDAAHAHMSMMHGKAAGTFGVAGCYSFFATKVMTSGEGGMVITRDDELAAKIRLYRDHGKPEPWVSEHTAIGTNWRMNELEAAVGLVQYRRLPQFIQWRERIAKMYRREMARLDGLNVLWPSETCSWYKFIVRLPDGVNRATLKARMKQLGVSLSGGVYDLPLHRQPVARTLAGWQGEFPGADRFCADHVCLPMYFGMMDDEVEQVLVAFWQALKDQGGEG